MCFNDDMCSGSVAAWYLRFKNTPATEEWHCQKPTTTIKLGNSLGPGTVCFRALSPLDVRTIIMQRSHSMAKRISLGLLPRKSATIKSLQLLLSSSTFLAVIVCTSSGPRALDPSCSRAVLIVRTITFEQRDLCIPVPGRPSNAAALTWFAIQGSGFGVLGLGFEDQGLGFGVWG